MESQKKHSPTCVTEPAKRTPPGSAWASWRARYLSGPFEVFEARRAAREVLWDLTALIDGLAAGQ